ncbi:MAG: sugar ABC transporter ATP-binding protein [Bacillota bacterium]
MGVIITAKNLKKEYPGVVAVSNFSFDICEGEIVGLVGENGAGKSTTINMLSGVVEPTKGQIFFEGKEVKFNNPLEASELGIGIVFQELSLVGSLSIAENIYMNRQPVTKFGNVDFKQLNKDAQKMIDIFELPFSPTTKVEKLRTGERQLIEILKAISKKPKLLILDEPTSSLTEIDVEILFKVIKRLRKEGMSFIYVSHKINEIFELCDRVIIMRDGNYVSDYPTIGLTKKQIVTDMVGRVIENFFGERRNYKVSKESVLEVKNISCEGKFKNVSFNAKKGEILGLFGLVGSGRTEVGLGLYGHCPIDSGEVYLEGEKVNFQSPKEAIKNGLVYLTEDRKELGLYLEKRISDNLVATKLDEFSNKYGFINENSILNYSEDIVDKYGITTSDSSKYIVKLSGGNQQKVLFAMMLELNPKIIIFDEPTRGVDVGAKSEIYNKINEYASKNKGVIVISSEAPELVGLCDRVIVMRNKEVVGEVTKESLTEKNLVSLASGIMED